MKIKQTIILVVILLVVFLATLYFTKIPVQSPIVEEDPSQPILGDPYIYADKNGEKLKIYYYNTDNTATLYFDEENRIVFYATTTGSGARYASDDSRFVLWNKGNEINLYLNDSLIFTGTTTSADITQATSTQ